VSHGVLSLLARLERFGKLAENATLVVLLGSLVLLAVGQIILREIFETGFFRADELIKLLVLWLAMVGSIAATRDNRHIRIDALSHLLPDKAVTAIRLFVDVFAAAVCGVVAWQAWRYLQLEIEFEDTVLINVPAWIAHAVVPGAFALMSYRFAVSVIHEIILMVAGRKRRAML
jgi:TRAP-type C4-dicarboxylate transport system permease small subunit